MLRVLYVDDDDDIREIATLSLELDGELEVKSTGDAEEALALAGDWRPDVIPLDFLMPQMDGPEMLRRLRGMPETTEIPVIFVTARSKRFALEEFEQLGVVGIISKPFDPMGLAGETKGLLAQRG